MLKTSHLKIVRGVTPLSGETPRATPLEGRRLLDHREDSAEESTPEHGTGGSAHREIACGVTVPTNPPHFRFQIRGDAVSRIAPLRRAAGHVPRYCRSLRGLQNHDSRRRHAARELHLVFKRRRRRVIRTRPVGGARPSTLADSDKSAVSSVEFAPSNPTSYSFTDCPTLKGISE